MKIWIANSLVTVFLGAFAVPVQAQQSNAVATGSGQDGEAMASISVEVDDDYKRPLVRFASPKDKNGDTPQDVMKKFMSCIEKQDVAGARKLCRLKQGEDNAWKTMGEEKFAPFCKNFGSHVQTVKVSGSAVNDKEDYWAVFYRLTTRDDETAETRLYLTRVDGNWRIIESPSWKRVSDGDFVRFYW